MDRTSGFQLIGSGPESYEICWVTAQMARCAEDLVSAACVGPGDRVLDVGCGTGVVAREAARRTGSGHDVTGTDINAGMLEIARDFAARHDLPNIQWRQSDAVSLTLPDETFDVVLCQQGLQFMPDRAAAMAEMARVLAPGGRLAVSVWRSVSPFGTALSEVFDRRFGAGTSAPWQVVYSLGDRDELRALSVDAGLLNSRVHFDIKFLRHPDPQVFIQGALAGSPVAEIFSGVSEAERADIVGEIANALKYYQDDAGLAVPVECHTLLAEKP